jgi:hypothetical protein
MAKLGAVKSIKNITADYIGELPDNRYNKYPLLRFAKILYKKIKRKKNGKGILGRGI